MGLLSGEVLAHTDKDNRTYCTFTGKSVCTFKEALFKVTLMSLA
jgi:hypothetical protein